MANVELTDKLNKLYRYFSVIPTAYDDSLSYYEQICAVLKLTLETLEDYQNTLNESKQYTDAAISKLKNDITVTISNLENTFNNKLSATNNRINETNNYIDEQLKNISNEFNKVYAQITTSIENNNDFIFEEISKNLAGELLVTNFFTGQRITIQAMFDYLSSFHAENGINYDTLVERNYSYDELAALKISYTQLVMNGNTLIPAK